MISQLSIELAGCDGYRVYAEGRHLGHVEEIWLGSWDAPTAVVVRLLDGRRGLLVASDVAGVWPMDRFLTLTDTGRLLELEPPHLGPDGDGTLLAASWRTSGDVLEVGAQPRRIGDLVHGTFHPVRAAEGEDERPLWRTVAGLYLSITAIVASLIGLDILVSYLVSGSPPY